MRNKPYAIRALRREKRARIRQEFRRIYPYHEHAWDFSDRRYKWYIIRHRHTKNKEFHADMRDQIDEWFDENHQKRIWS